MVSKTDKLLDLALKDTEKYKDDSKKSYRAIRKINSHKLQTPLAIFDSEYNHVTSAQDQVT